MFYSHPELDAIIERHRIEAEDIILSSGSKRLGEIFQQNWVAISRNSIVVDSSSDILAIRPTVISSFISSWIREVELFRQQKEAELNSIEKPTPAERLEFQRLNTHINGRVIVTYEMIKRKINPLFEEFANATLAYISPLHQATNDMNQLYNEMNNIRGDFTGFGNVSVYIHGIEDTGKDFLESAIEAAEDGDIIVYEDRNGVKHYYTVSMVKGVKEVNDKPYTLGEIKLTDHYNDKNGRLHLVYETEFKNEHRQKTSNDLAEKLINMGLLNDETKIDLFAHSYGGRRSLQFAMDYPFNVRSITTIGTPYDKNFLGSAANTFTGIAGKMGKEPSEFSYYLDFNSKNQRKDDGITHSNVYTDMASEKMMDDIEQLKVANPHAYKELENTVITAAVGRDVQTYSYYNGNLGTNVEYVIEDSNDGAVSVKSQRGESLGSLIDNQPVFDVKGYGITNPAHVHQIKDEGFVELIKQVNKEQKE